MSRAFPSVLTGERLPPRLRDLPSPPTALFVRGDLPRGPAVAIVGTRSPSEQGAAFARELARDLALAGAAIFSGGARGIDTHAHLGALEACGVTVVMAPAGYAVPFPAENADLFRRVVESGGAYAALVPDDQVAVQPAFFKRNSCLAALAHVLVVVESPIRSGARNAAAWARRLGRPLLVVPSAPWIRTGLGCIAELRLGARVCDSARTVLDVLEQNALRPIPGSPSTIGSIGRSMSADLGPLDPSPQAALFESASVSGALTPAQVEDRVLQAMDGEVTHADELCLRLGLPAARVQQALLTLSLQGALVPAPAGGFKRLTRRKN